MKDIKEGIELDFNGREPAQASTSKYIQTNITSKEGYRQESVAGTPDDNIIKPNLKVFNCETVSIQLPFGLGSLPIPLPFVKTKNKKEIKEVMPSKEKSQYGKIMVTETKGGFVELKDETPDNKRTLKLHPSGTYTQTINDGSIYDKVVGDVYTIIDKNWNIAIGKDFIEVITGDNKIQIKKNSELNINGNESVNIDGNSNTNIGGNKGIQIDGNESEDTTGNKDTKISGNLTENISKNKNTTIVGNDAETVLKNKTSIVQEDCTTLVGGNITISAKGNINVVASGVCNIKASQINLN